MHFFLFCVCVCVLSDYFVVLTSISKGILLKQNDLFDFTVKEYKEEESLMSGSLVILTEIIDY